jgi:hypothetical protein
MHMTSSLTWALWACLSLGATVALTRQLLGEDTDKTLFLPGPTSHGHYQIELSCQSCHADAFTSQTTLQAACERCHGKELEAADDSHPKAKFTDPRNADRVELLDARQCVTCHVEHRPEMEQGMGLTLPRDYCFKCHQAIAEERPTHQGMEFDSCASAGCHNFHDNRALYEDFLAKRADEPALFDEPKPLVALAKSTSSTPLMASQADAPAEFALSSAETEAWLKSAHATHGINCSKCHSQSESWSSEVSLGQCQECHSLQAEGWQAGRHGMRVAQGLPPMTPGLARLPMKDGVRGHELDCSSCHDAHGYDTRRAAVEACAGCHTDVHTKSYFDSPHYELWQRELAGQGAVGSGVSCATCHMPRVAGDERSFVEHNQNANLRPNEKMIRTVCNRCHGVPFAIDALADADLVLHNFRAQPGRHIASVDMATQRAPLIQ